MKQNERILVYLVTGFLAVILVVAVMFGRDSNSAGNSAGRANASTAGLTDLLGQQLKDDGKAKGDGKSPAAGGTEPQNALGLTVPEQVVGQQPLVAGKLDFAAGQVLQQLGQSRRDRTVRFVRARPGDSLDTLVQRWCGARGALLDEAKSLNEDLVVLRAGQEVAVPWVDDAVVLAALEARQPKKLSTEGIDGLAASLGSPLGSPHSQPSEAAEAGGADARPSFAQPGDGTAVPASAPRDSGVRADAANTKSYTVKAGDSLWKVAARLYGKGKADRMIAEIRRLNPGLGDTLRPGQTFLVPAGEEGAPATPAPTGA